ncbi:hypothetical protein J3Q64DRAFT_1707611 [Phycomyces blakesleeanus]|uniref:Transmembrane protein 135 N-terminal domain-containing protein n=2 Tax=Phycomyces blakesleeanus TaxID=4837 RepID=A0A162UQM5_PHYB8|nr:hypothetical protein PHYBLDRAFT_122406 [Phycomyces blakesleeanus NRRL 1555(-)]OAD77492.1 hypothetical protein PHYBLDRAFT_122406 [Phycomyces blakesleeanus NRRL 1555(-)]|eukprot:XP_018295532.1 hypothetical protein PHYBLDRAFT_122406 [Phycomyces blakesleeanus NRRL 1555(-)]
MEPPKPPHRVSSYQRLKVKLHRPPQENPVPKDWHRPSNLEELIHHALKGGARAFLLAYGVRAGVNFCLYLLRVMRKKAPIANILAASFKNLDALRFGAMFGSFALLWKSVNNGMRLYRGKEDRLNGFVGGAAAGLAILFEKPNRRVDIAQQLLVRAVQAIYNAGKARDIFYFKNGDSLLFGLTCAQILYAYTMQPQTLPPDFYVFMVKAARVPESLLRLNAKNIRKIPFEAGEALHAIKRHRPTQHAIDVVSKLSSLPVVTPCEAVHPWMDSCNSTAIERFSLVFKSMMPVYGTLHFVPLLLLRTKSVLESPVKMLSRTAINTIKSGAFLASFVSIYQAQVCVHRKLVDMGITSMNSKYFHFCYGFVCAYTSIFIEDKKRRSELALYVLPKAIQSLYLIAYQHRLIFKLKHFEVLMSSAAMAVIMSFYQDEPDVLSNFVRKIMVQFFGKN